MAWSDVGPAVQPYIDRISIWRGYEAELKSLGILAVGVALYTLLVFALYQNLSRRKAFHTGWGDGTWWGNLLRFLETTLVVPAMSFLFFSLLASSLFLLGRSQTTYQILLIAMAVVVSVRLIAYLNQNASNDLAKLLPLSLLGVLIVDPTYATTQAIWARFQDVLNLFPVIWRFGVGLVVAEGTLTLARLGVARIARWWRERPTRVSFGRQKGPTPGLPDPQKLREEEFTTLEVLGPEDAPKKRA